MELPRKYPCNPSLKALLAGLALICIFPLLFAHAARHPEVGLYIVPLLLGGRTGAQWFYGVMAAVSAAVVAAQGMRIARRAREQRFLELTEEAITLPHGVLRVSDVRLPYPEIERVWQGKLFEKPVLYLKSGGRIYSVRPGQLPDMASYTEVREFLYARVKLRRAPGGPGIG